MLAAEKIYGAAIEAVSTYRLVTSAVSFNPADKTLAISGRSLQVDRCASAVCIPRSVYCVCTWWLLQSAEVFLHVDLVRYRDMYAFLEFTQFYCVIVEYSVLYTFNMGHEKVFEFCGTTTVPGGL